MSAREQALPAALEEAVRSIAPGLLTAAVDSVGSGDEDATKVADWILSALRAAWPAVRRELLAEVEAEHWAAKEPGLADHYRALADAACDAVDLDADADDLAPTDLRTRIYERISEAARTEPAQPPASGEPPEDYREELVKHCVDSGLPESYVSEDPAATARKIAELDRALDEEIEERDRNAEWADKLAFAIEGLTGVEVGEHSSANNPWRVALEAAEAPLPADWREAVEGALPCSGLLNCYIDREVGEETHSTRCAAYYLSTVLSALRRLHLGSGAGEVRARRALAELWAMYKTAASHEEATVKAGAIVGAALAQPPSEPAAALEALLGELDSNRGIGAMANSTYFARRLREAVGWEEGR